MTTLRVQGELERKASFLITAEKNQFVLEMRKKAGKTRWWE
jgi:hypothetical protein